MIEDTLVRIAVALEAIANTNKADRNNREDDAARQALQDKRDAKTKASTASTEVKQEVKPEAKAKAKPKAEAAELDYSKDVQPACLKLVAKDKAAFIAILRKYDLQKASETAAVPHYAAILADVQAALEAYDV